MWWAIRRRHARIAREELLHPVFVAGHDHDQVVALVLHDLQEDLDGLLPVVLLVLGAVEVVRLVDEQHAAHRLLEDLLGLGRGVTDVLAHQVVAGHRHDVALAHVAEPVEDPRHLHGHRGLPGARVAGEAHVQSRRLRRETHARAHLLDQQQRGDLADAPLHRLQADQVAVDLVEDLAEPGLLELAREVDSGGRGVGETRRQAPRPRSRRCRRPWRRRRGAGVVGFLHRERLGFSIGLGGLHGLVPADRLVALALGGGATRVRQHAVPLLAARSAGSLQVEPRLDRRAMHDERKRDRLDSVLGVERGDPDVAQRVVAFGTRRSRS